MFSKKSGNTAMAEAVQLLNELKFVLVQEELPDQEAMRDYLRQAHSIHARLLMEQQGRDTLSVMELMIGDLYVLYEDLFGEDAVDGEMRENFARFASPRQTAA